MKHVIYQTTISLFHKSIQWYVLISSRKMPRLAVKALKGSISLLNILCFISYGQQLIQFQMPTRGDRKVAAAGLTKARAQR